ncbi:MAG: helix-turn-helix domain-containing protein [Clostridiales bacterium]|nr:helix-turn-helix domain-containing protein [Clostridiales bacterium]
MRNVDFDYLSRTLANLSGIPVRVYSNDCRICYHSVVNLPEDPIKLYKNELFSVENNVGYFITPRFHIYGIVKSGEYRIIAGPTAQITTDEQSLRELAFQIDVSKDDRQTFVDGMKSIANLPLESLMMMLCSVNYFLNDEKLELSDIAISNDELLQIKQQVEQQRTEKVYHSAQKQPVHNTLQIEETLLHIVRHGDSAALKQWISTAPPIRAGIIAADQLRQLKNTFIVTATLTSRAAIRGGLSPEDALSLSDAYIQRVEQIETQNEITNLQYSMILEFTEQVEKIRKGNESSKLAIEAANYVRHHLSEPIDTEAMAKEFYLSRTHFSAKFKKETGSTLTDFIHTEKTDEAKRLLRYSDKSSAFIGEYLGYSSQGHFSRVFKKYTGLTPNEYREKYQR